VFKQKRGALHFINALYKIAYQFLDFAIADNLLEIHNEANLFYLPNLGSKQTTLTGLSLVGITV
jgi:hypothetical protein